MLSISSFSIAKTTKCQKFQNLLMFGYDIQNFGFTLRAMYVGWQSLSVNCLPESISFPLNFLQIIFVENKKLKSTLLEDIDESQLPDVYGGKLSLVPIQDD